MTAYTSNRRQQTKARTYGFVNLRGEVQTFASIMNFTHVTLMVGKFGMAYEQRKFHSLEAAQAHQSRNHRDGMETIICPVLPKERFAEFAQAQAALQAAAEKHKADLKAAQEKSARAIAVRSAIQPFNRVICVNGKS